MDIFQIRGTILFIAAFLNLFFAFILWSKGKDKAVFHLGFVAFFSAVYALAFGMYYFFPINSLFQWKTTWLGVFILPAYITFVYCFTERTKYLKLKSLMWYLGAIIISYLALTTSLFVKIVKYPDFIELGPLHPFGRVYIITVLAISLYYLAKEYLKSQGFRKLQIKYFIFGISIYTVSGLLFVGILPLLSPKFILYTDIPAFISVFWVALTTYAIFSKKLFEIKVILTEFLVGVMGIILLILPFVIKTTLPMKILMTGVFLLFCLFGYYLIRYAHREASQKEILEDKVQERTKELESAKDVAENRAKEIERWHRVTVGRELRMIELKKEIKELEEKSKKE